MAVNKLLPFANGESANVVDYTTWSALSQILGQGFVTGVARSDYANRLFSQGALASYILGQFVVDQTAQDADLDESVFYTNFKNALVSYIKQNAVSLDTAQTVGGVKTFTSSPTVPTADAGDNTQKVANTAFVKTAIDNSVLSVKAVSYGAQTLIDAEKTQARSNIGAPADSEVVKLTNSQTVSGDKNFTGLLQHNGYGVDSVVASGTGYIRYESGLQICFGNGGDILEAGQTIHAVSYPVPFIEKAGVTYSFSNAQSNTGMSGATSTGFNAVTATARDYGIFIYYVAIGYWK